ncbi:hint-domain-containing protein [Polychytrium aggregatum]|uniref:hint-domain-containing protein n=1 Tax=Polychytrium aggregatum TaxID=110093 RepID=UPI0022FE9537|nr:hint-domain-containing protein [Polychytrium aggregatum]KAI9208346.1 hint-domain-containing protein [Polychytrium aggregatum]
MEPDYAAPAVPVAHPFVAEAVPVAYPDAADAVPVAHPFVVDAVPVAHPFVAEAVPAHHVLAQPVPAHHVLAQPVPVQAGAVADSKLWEQVSVSLRRIQETDELLVIIQPPALQQRAPLNICCVIDVSYSMSDEASVTNANGIRESDGLTTLDIVKHAVNTIIRSLNENDTISIVSFSNTARVILEPTRVTPENLNHALARVDDLDYESNTNLWAGLHAALDVLKAQQSNNTIPDCISSIVLLTDGCPNTEPPRGHIPTLQNYIRTKMRGNLNAVLSTYGFGYSLLSDLLDDIATVGNGSYSFIPDASFVGTTFIHAVANLLVTRTMKAKLTVSFGDHNPVSETLDVYGVIQSGQNRHLIKENSQLAKAAKNSIARRPKALVKLEVDGHIREFEVNIEQISETDELYGVQRARLDAVKAIERGLAAPGTGTAIINELITRIATSPVANHQQVAALLKDLRGQISQAFQPQYIDRWGKHFLRSIRKAHLSEQCNNFKDPGVQVYGDDYCKDIINDIEDIFLRIPPPVNQLAGGGAAAAAPANQNALQRGAPGGNNPIPNMHDVVDHGPVPYNAQVVEGNAPGANYAGAHQPTRPGAAQDQQSDNVQRQPYMFRFLASGNPCFAEGTRVRMAGADTTFKHIEDLVAGDQLHIPAAGQDTSDARSATVLCVIKTPQLPLHKTALVKLADKAILTPWHPVLLPGSDIWSFPSELADTHYSTECPAVYNLVLDQGHVIELDGGIQSVTLAHGFSGDIREHRYFGSQLCLESLQQLDGFEQGRVIVRGILRDEDGNVCGFDRGEQ